MGVHECGVPGTGEDVDSAIGGAFDLGDGELGSSSASFSQYHSIVQHDEPGYSGEPDDRPPSPAASGSSRSSVAEEEVSTHRRHTEDDHEEEIEVEATPKPVVQPMSLQTPSPTPSSPSRFQGVVASPSGSSTSEFVAQGAFQDQDVSPSPSSPSRNSFPSHPLSPAFLPPADDESVSEHSSVLMEQGAFEDASRTSSYVTGEPAAFASRSSSYVTGEQAMSSMEPPVPQMRPVMRSVSGDSEVFEDHPYPHTQESSTRDMRSVFDLLNDTDALLQRLGPMASITPIQHPTHSVPAAGNLLDEVRSAINHADTLLAADSEGSVVSDGGRPAVQVPVVPPIPPPRSSPAAPVAVEGVAPQLHTEPPDEPEVSPHIEIISPSESLYPVPDIVVLDKPVFDKQPALPYTVWFQIFVRLDLSNAAVLDALQAAAETLGLDAVHDSPVSMTLTFSRIVTAGEYAASRVGSDLTVAAQQKGGDRQTLISISAMVGVSAEPDFDRCLVLGVAFLSDLSHSEQFKITEWRDSLARIRLQQPQVAPSLQPHADIACIVVRALRSNAPSILFSDVRLSVHPGDWLALHKDYITDLQVRLEEQVTGMLKSQATLLDQPGVRAEWQSAALCSMLEPAFKAHREVLPQPTKVPALSSLPLNVPTQLTVPLEFRQLIENDAIDTSRELDHAAKAILQTGATTLFRARVERKQAHVTLRQQHVFAYCKSLIGLLETRVAAAPEPLGSDNKVLSSSFGITNEPVLYSCAASCEKRVGRLYVTPKRVCFHASMLGFAHMTKNIPFNSLRGLQEMAATAMYPKYVQLIHVGTDSQKAQGLRSILETDLTPLAVDTSRVLLMIQFAALVCNHPASTSFSVLENGRAVLPELEPSEASPAPSVESSTPSVVAAVAVDAPETKTEPSVDVEEAMRQLQLQYETHEPDHTAAQHPLAASLITVHTGGVLGRPVVVPPSPPQAATALPPISEASSDEVDLSLYEL